MIDTSILIDYFRKSNKANSRLIAHFRKMLQRLTILDFDGKAARQAAIIVEQLKAKRKTIDKPRTYSLLLLQSYMG